MLSCPNSSFRKQLVVRILWNRARRSQRIFRRCERKEEKGRERKGTTIGKEERQPGHGHEELVQLVLVPSSASAIRSLKISRRPKPRVKFSEDPEWGSQQQRLCAIKSHIPHSTSPHRVLFIFDMISYDQRLPMEQEAERWTKGWER